MWILGGLMGTEEDTIVGLIIGIRDKEQDDWFVLSFVLVWVEAISEGESLCLC